MRLRHHRAFGASGGAGSVDDDGHLVVVERHVVISVRRAARAVDQRTGRIVTERVNDRFAGFASELQKTFMRRRPAHHDARFRVLQKVAQFGRLVGGVQRQITKTGTQAREVKEQRVRAFVDLRRDAIAASQAQSGQIGRQARTLALQVGVGVMLAAIAFDDGFGQAQREGAREISVRIHPMTILQCAYAGTSGSSCRSIQSI